MSHINNAAAILNSKESLPNQNPLISEHTSETLTNVNDVVKMLQELIADYQWSNEESSNDPKNFNVSESAASGIYLVLKCVTQALDYETEHGKLK